MRLIRVALAILAVFMTSMAFGNGFLTVISPVENDVLGTNNTVSFSITGASKAVTITLTLTGNDSNTSGTVLSPPPTVFTNVVDNKVNGTVPLNLSKSLPEGSYVLQVTATEPDNTYNVPAPIDVTVVLTPPKFLDFSPNNGQFVKGIVPITVSVETAHIKDWHVQVNGQDIPNNTGNTTSFVVNWDTTNIQTDGGQTITVTVRDLANNTVTQTISVTLDRLPPTITVQYPRSDTPLLANSRIPILIDIQDASTNSVDVTGTDVVLLRMDNSFLMRVPRQSFNSIGNNTLRWSGRLRPSINLPNQFILQVTAVDRAGNVGVLQKVTLSHG